MTTTTDYIWGDDYNCILPDHLTVQIKSADNKNLELELVYCSIYIYVHEDTCYALHLIPTDSKGKFTLKKNDIIFNTELQFYYTDRLPLDKSQVKFEITITPKDFVKNLTKVAEDALNDRANKVYERPLNWHSARQKYFDEQFDRVWPDIKKNKNLGLEYNSNKSSISGQWTETGDHEYNLIMQL
jgi:hypothetical protein